MFGTKEILAIFILCIVVIAIVHFIRSRIERRSFRKYPPRKKVNEME